MFCSWSALGLFRILPANSPQPSPGRGKAGRRLRTLPKGRGSLGVVGEGMRAPKPSVGSSALIHGRRRGSGRAVD